MEGAVMGEIIGVVETVAGAGHDLSLLEGPSFVH